MPPAEAKQSLLHKGHPAGYTAFAYDEEGFRKNLFLPTTLPGIL